VKAEGMKVYKKGKWAFQQDLGTEHEAKITQNWCKTNFRESILSSKYPSSSNNLNPPTILFGLY